jgi:thiol:disulfide interchange protein/DsbC/DsbD-like thiol-disulfide interchange protein
MLAPLFSRAKNSVFPSLGRLKSCRLWLRPEKNSRFLGMVLACLLALNSVQSQDYEGQTLVQSSLLSSRSAVVPGETFTVGVLLQMAPGWHTYWLYPGDAGMDTRMTWSLPPGFQSGPIEWPLPLRLVEPGDLYVYAYKGQVLLLTQLTAPADLSAESVTLAVSVDWLVCEDLCIPGSANLELTLPVATSADPTHTGLFETFETLVPSVETPPFSVAWKALKDGWQMDLSGLPAGSRPDFYPLPGDHQQVGHAEVSEGGEEGDFIIQISAEGGLAGVLVVEKVDGERHGWMVASSEVSPADALFSDPGGLAGLGFFTALLYGFLGGLILNVMPCVLPVISLKIFGFMQQAGEDPRKVFRHGLAFTAGIFVWFLVLGGVIVALQAGGQQVTWAFQFQNPWFIFFISTVVFVFALNLFGVFEVVLPGTATTKMAEVSSHGGYRGSFFQGGFATLLATPCTAPFLGPALGFAFSQPPGVILSMFGAVALGMASPYLLLSAKPGWMKYLPKPGAWMERVKQFLGFPLLATVLWLLYVLGNQKGLEAVIWTSAFLLMTGLAFWIYGQLACVARTRSGRLVATFFAMACFVAGGWWFGGAFAATEPGTVETSRGGGGIDWQEFSPQRVETLRREGTPVFVDFTADWCLTCKFNERTAINTPAVRSLMQEKGVVPVKADWTNSNPDITAALASFGRVGVPFYVLYPADGKDPVVLPELLTEGLLLDALRKAR